MKINKIHEKLSESKGTDDNFAPSMDAGWSWIAMIDRLSDGDITKHDYIYGYTYIRCLNLLSYWKAKDNYIDMVNKRNNK